MSRLVLDTSVVVKWFLPEAGTEAAVELANAGHDLHAPDFLLIELESVLFKRVLRNEIGTDMARDVRKAVRLFPLTFHPAVGLAESAFEMAVKTRRSVYDCLFVSLAVLLDCRLATADGKLAAGLKGSGLESKILLLQQS